MLIRDLKEIYSINEVSELLKVSKSTIRRWIREGELKAFKVGKGWRISKEDLINSDLLKIKLIEKDMSTPGPKKTQQEIIESETETAALTIDMYAKSILNYSNTDLLDTKDLNNSINELLGAIEKLKISIENKGVK